VARTTRCPGALARQRERAGSRLKMHTLMKRFLLLIAVIVTVIAPLRAQPAAPAQPASPDQARPATPVNVDELTPNGAPAPATNAAPTPPAAAASVSIIAESSLKAVLQELAQTWADSQDNSPQVPLTLTNSGTIAAKVEAGPGFDVVISANLDDLKAMTDKSVLLAGNQRMLARNVVVIYGRKALLKDDGLDWFDLIGNEWKKVALGKPDQVASGRVAQRALQRHGLDDDDHQALYSYAMTDSLALGVVQRDQADAAFAFKSDVAKMNLNGFEIYPIDTADAPPVFYTAAVCRLSKNPDRARAFIDFCASDAAKAIWAKHGFETN
jgi:molybdate transport system substrate-binding protein